MSQRQGEMAVLTVLWGSGYIYNKVSHSCHFSLSKWQHRAAPVFLFLYVTVWHPAAYVWLMKS